CHRRLLEERVVQQMVVVPEAAVLEVVVLEVVVVVPAEELVDAAAVVVPGVEAPEAALADGKAAAVGEMVEAELKTRVAAELWVAALAELMGHGTLVAFDRLGMACCEPGEEVVVGATAMMAQATRVRLLVAAVEVVGAAGPGPVAWK
ncbi:hypothetical protein GGI09_003142, partial [Coemansia sp. S100]